MNPYRKNVVAENDGLVHIGFEVRPHGEETGSFMLACRAVWTREITEETVTCLGCLAASSSTTAR